MYQAVAGMRTTAPPEGLGWSRLPFTQLPNFSYPSASALRTHVGFTTAASRHAATAMHVPCRVPGQKPRQQLPASLVPTHLFHLTHA